MAEVGRLAIEAPRALEVRADLSGNVYTATLDWIVDNADERKIEYVAHTGDIMENWHTASERDDEEEYRQIAIEARNPGLLHTVACRR